MNRILRSNDTEIVVGFHIAARGVMKGLAALLFVVLVFGMSPLDKYYDYQYDKEHYPYWCEENPDQCSYDPGAIVRFYAILPLIFLPIWHIFDMPRHLRFTVPGYLTVVGYAWWFGLFIGPRHCLQRDLHRIPLANALRGETSEGWQAFVGEGAAWLGKVYSLTVPNTEGNSVTLYGGYDPEPPRFIMQRIIKEAEKTQGSSSY